MSRMSSLNQPSAGVSGASLEEEDRAAPDAAQSEMTISQMSRAIRRQPAHVAVLRGPRAHQAPPRRKRPLLPRADRVRMEMILKGKKLGFTLTEIQDLIGGKGANETPDLEEQLNPQQIVTQIGHLERQRERDRRAPSSGCGRRKAVCPRRRGLIGRDRRSAAAPAWSTP